MIRIKTTRIDYLLNGRQKTLINKCTHASTIHQRLVSILWLGSFKAFTRLTNISYLHQERSTRTIIVILLRMIFWIIIKKGANVIIELLVNELYDWMILTCIRLRCVQRLNQRLKWWFESRKEAFLWIFSDLFNRCCFSFFFARGGRFNGSNDREKTSTINEEKKEMKSNKREKRCDELTMCTDCAKRTRIYQEREISRMI